MTSSPSDVASLLSSLTLTSHPLLTAQMQRAQALCADRRYQQAEEEIKQYMKQTQEKIKENMTHTTSAAADSSSAASASAASSSSSSLPTLSQLMTTFLPFLRRVSVMRRENECATYDLHTITQEMKLFQHKLSQHQQQPAADPPTRPLHAEYVSPSLSLRLVSAHNRGLVATESIPAHTTLMMSRAVGFVSDEATPEETADEQDDADSEAATAAASREAAHEERMATSLVTLLAIKIKQQPELAKQIYQLDAGEKYEQDRQNRLEKINSAPLEMYRPIVNTNETATVDGSTDVEEVDLSRLALIVARNAFAPPSDNPPPPPSSTDDAAADAAVSSSSPPPVAMHSTGLWVPCSYLNHSCRPNCHWFCVGDIMFVRTLRNIPLHTELTISYTGFDAKCYRERQNKCKEWGFTCHCEWCEIYESHPALSAIEDKFSSDILQLEPKVHQLVDQVQRSEEGTLAYKNGLTALRACKTQLETKIDQFKSKIKQTCGEECKGKGIKDEDMEADETKQGESANVNSSDNETGKNKKKAASSSSSSSTSTSLFSSHPSHTRCLLLHLSLPLTLLALCHVSVHDSTSTEKSYLQSLKKHEELTLTAIDLLSRHYGAGDETSIVSWFQLINTWMQFASGGIQYRTEEEMQACMRIVIQRHEQQFGANFTHFQDTWNELMENMGIKQLLE